MGKTVNGLVERLGGEIIQHQDSGATTGEVVFQGQNLPPIAQRTLRQQPDLRQGVEHDARGLRLLDGIEDQLGRLAQLEVG